MDDKNVMKISCCWKGRLRPVCTRRDRVSTSNAPDVQSCTERFSRHAGYPVRQNGGKGLVSHRPCRMTKVQAVKKKFQSMQGWQTQKSCRVLRQLFSVLSLTSHTGPDNAQAQGMIQYRQRCTKAVRQAFTVFPKNRGCNMKRNFYSMYCCFLDLSQLASLVLQAVSMKTQKMHRMFLKRN